MSSEGYDIANNRTKVYAKSVLNNSGAWLDSYGSTTASVSCTGLTTQSGKKEQRYQAGETTLFETSGYVTHNTDGTKSITVGGSWISTPWGINKSTSATVTLPTIPRYVSILSFTISKYTEQVVKGNWSVNADVSYAYCRHREKGTSAWSDWRQVSWPNFEYGGLTASKKYEFQLKVIRADSGLPTESWVVEQETYDYPHCIESPNFKIGDPLTLKFYNPLGRNITIYVIGNNGAEIGGATTTGESITSYNYDEIVKWWYSTIPDSPNGTYKVKVVYGNSTRITQGGTYIIKGDEKPTFNDFDWETNDYSNLTGDSQTVIKGFSSIKTIVSNNNKAVAQKSASIKSYQTIIGTKSKTNSTITYPVETTVNNIDTLIISVFANDSRGLSTKVDKPISNFIDLIPLSINKMEIDRTPNNDEEVNLKIEGVIDTVDFGLVTNAINRSRYYYKRKDSNSYIEGSTNLQFTYEKITGTQHKFFVNQTIEGDIENGFSSNGEYDIKVTISDKLTEVTKETSLEQGSPAIAILGNNVALGAPYNESLGGRVQINGQEAGDTLKVSSIEPGSGVWFKKSKNLFNIKGNFKAQYGYPTVTENSITLPSSTDNIGSTKFEQLIPVYGPLTLSFVASNGNGYARPLLMPLDSNENVITNLTIEGYTYLNTYKGYYKDLPDGYYKLTLNFPENVKYFKLGFIHIYAKFTDIQIEEGENATDYSPFEYNKIFTKNIYGDYEVFYDENYIKSEFETIYNSLKNKTEQKYLGNNPDINSMKSQSGVYGLYNCSQAPNTAIGVLEVLVYTGDWVVQRFTDVHAGSMWQRRFYSGTTWSDWQQKW